MTQCTLFSLQENMQCAGLCPSFYTARTLTAEAQECTCCMPTSANPVETMALCRKSLGSVGRGTPTGMGRCVIQREGRELQRTGSAARRRWVEGAPGCWGECEPRLHPPPLWPWWHLLRTLFP